MNNLKQVLLNSDINKVTELLSEYDINSIDDWGYNILHHYLNMINDVKICPELFLNLIISKGININQKTKGLFEQSPLLIALFKKDKEVFDLLISKNADINSIDSGGMSIISRAIILAKISKKTKEKADYYFVQKLINLGADMNIEDDYGISAKDLALRLPISEEQEDEFKYAKMNWKEIKKDISKIHPKREISICTLTTKNRTSLAWVNSAYAHYNYMKFCKYCVEIQIKLGKKDNKKEKLNRYQMYFKLAKNGNTKLDFEYIENYFVEHFSGICTALFLYIKTTKKGFKVKIYVDNIEYATNRLNEMKIDKNRNFDFDFKITEDENWDIIGMMLY